MSAAVAIENAALPPRMLKVIDVSAVQGNIDWKEVAADGIVGAYLKCTEGLAGADPTLRYNFTEARKYGIAVGAYHFAKPGTNGKMTMEEDARAEANRLYSMSDGLGTQRGELPPMFDFETMDGMDVAYCAAWGRVWIEEAEQLWQLDPLMYGGIPMVPVFQLMPTVSRLRLCVPAYPQYVIGHAGPAERYPGRAIYSKALTWEQAMTKQPPRIAPWSATGWTLWQFSGGMDNPSQLMPGNSVKGIKTWVDCNRFNGGEREWEAFARLA